MEPEPKMVLVWSLRRNVREQRGLNYRSSKVLQDPLNEPCWWELGSQRLAEIRTGKNAGIRMHRDWTTGL